MEASIFYLFFFFFYKCIPHVLWDERDKIFSPFWFISLFLRKRNGSFVVHVCWCSCIRRVSVEFFYLLFFDRHNYTPPFWAERLFMPHMSLYLSSVLVFSPPFSPSVTVLKYQSLFSLHIRWDAVNTKPIVYDIVLRRRSILCPLRQCYYASMTALRHVLLPIFLLRFSP